MSLPTLSESAALGRLERQRERDWRDLGVTSSEEDLELLERERDNALLDADTFTDWLGAKCMGKTAQPYDYVPGVYANQELLDLFRDQLPTMSESQLLYLAMSSLYWAGLAMEELRGRYLRERGLE